ncbi:MAG TPA: MarR family transcriptional regulator [Ktedonosporobacter sp.]|nr:MarR family transcriptional regulator [Ktedonosporobacter sp.]
MTEKQDQPIDEVSKLLFEILYNLQKTVMQDWQSLNMSMAQVKVLMLLTFKGDAAISKLADAMSITHPTASQLVDRLVQAGLVERVEQATDRRFTLARLTEAGQQLSQRLWQGRMGHLRQCLAQLDEQDLAALQQGLRALNLVTASLPTEPPAGDGPPEEHSCSEGVAHKKKPRSKLNLKGMLFLFSGLQKRFSKGASIVPFFLSGRHSLEDS